jgi:hypothetical protein
MMANWIGAIVPVPSAVKVRLHFGDASSGGAGLSFA